MPGEIVVALMTAPSADKAAEIARILVTEKLCACVNIVPGVRSIYMWNGSLCDEGETLCVIKTHASRVAALKERLVAVHPYAVPELLMLEVSDGLEGYLAWVAASCS